MVNLGAVHTAGEAELLGRHTQGSSSLPHAAAFPAFAVFPAAQQVACRKKAQNPFVAKLQRSELSCWSSRGHCGLGAVEGSQQEPRLQCWVVMLNLMSVAVHYHV